MIPVLLNPYIMVENFLSAIATLFNTLADHELANYLHIAQNVNMMLYTKLIRIAPQCQAFT